MRSDAPALVAAATKAMDSIEQKLTLNRAAETLYFRPVAGLGFGTGRHRSWPYLWRNGA